MVLTNTTVHLIKLENGERIKYLRLKYQAGGTVIGRSVLATRFRPEFVARIEAASCRCEKGGRVKEPLRSGVGEVDTSAVQPLSTDGLLRTYSVQGRFV